MEDWRPHIAVSQRIAMIAAVLSMALPIAVDAAPHSGTTPEVAPKAVPFDLADREGIYDEGKLSYGASIGYNLILPGLGNLYVDQFFTAGAVLGALMFSGILIGYGATNDQDRYTRAGLGVAAVAYSSSITMGLWGVSQYNRDLRSSLKIYEFAPIPPTGLSLTLTF
jgi:hypothetical protein